MKYTAQDIEGLSPEEKRALLVKLLQKKAGARGDAGAPEQERPAITEQFGTPVSELSVEAILDPAMQPAPVPEDARAEPRHILLTGATGFLGAFLLHELLRQTRADIYCLVRCSNEEDGRRRIMRNLESYLHRNGHGTSRIIPVAGDLAKPLLGLSEQHFATLAGTIDTIYHNGAMVNWIYPYEQLKPTNVLGTHEVLRLACQARAKPVHYISSLSVFPLVGNVNAKVLHEHTSLDHGGTLYGGYTQSKWVAEKLVTIARSRGLPVCIYRPGLITGHSQTGAWNTDDFTCKMIKSWIEVGYAPDLDATMDMTPVDYVSSAIVSLSLHEQSLGQVFHLANSRPIPVQELISWIRSFGYPIEYIDYDRWRSELLNLAERSRENAGYALMPLFSLEASQQVSGWASDVPRFGLQHTLDQLAPTSIVCPPADAELLATYFAYFIRDGFLSPPPHSKAVGKAHQ